MSGPVTLSDVQSLMAAQEANSKTRHTEVLDRFTATDRKVLRVEERVRQLELKEAEGRPLLGGIKTVLVTLFTALCAGFVGGYINVS